MTTDPQEPASPSLAAGLAFTVTQIYGGMELAVLSTVAAPARAAVAARDPLATLMTRSAATQRAARRLADRADFRAHGAVRDALAEAYRRGRGSPGPIARALAEVMARLATLRTTVMNWVAALWNRLTGAMSAPDPRATADRVLQRAAQTGITGHDGRGQRGVVSAATEVVQHGAGGAAIDGWLGRLADDGGDLVIVGESPHPCPVCQPWENRVLSVAGADSRRPSVAEARAAGLWHPRCHHTVYAWHPGWKRPSNALRHRPGSYEATQRQRAIERHIRDWKRREAVALDDTTRLAAARKVRDWQAELRHHLAAEGLKRSRQRERPDYGHTSPLKHALGG